MEASINSLIGAGADAMSNMYEVEFYPPAGFAYSSETQMKVRVKGFSPPAPEQLTYDVNWKSVSIKQGATKITLDRSLSFEFRLDANYGIYKDLLSWQAMTMDAAAGYAANDGYKRGKIIVRALSTPIQDASYQGGTEDFNWSFQQNFSIWYFEDVWITGITPPTYSTDDASALTVTAKFAYGNYKDPASN